AARGSSPKSCLLIFTRNLLAILINSHSPRVFNPGERQRGRALFYVAQGFNPENSDQRFSLLQPPFRGFLAALRPLLQLRLITHPNSGQPAGTPVVLGSFLLLFEKGSPAHNCYRGDKCYRKRVLQEESYSRDSPGPGRLISLGN